MRLREAFEKAATEPRVDRDRYQLTFELMHGRLPTGDERDMIKRRCLWYENDHVDQERPKH